MKFIYNPIIKTFVMGFGIFLILIGATIIIFFPLAMISKTSYIFIIIGAVISSVGNIWSKSKRNIKLFTTILGSGLLLTCLSNYQQTIVYEVKNRPYINIEPLKFDLDSKGAFVATLRIKNYGNIAGIVENIEVFPFTVDNDSFIDRIDCNKLKYIPISLINKEWVRETRNVPIFPNEEKPYNIFNPLSHDDVKKLTKSDGLTVRDFAIWIKFTYRPIGEARAYYFWSVIKRPNKFIACGVNDLSFKDTVYELNAARLKPR